jgi:SET domain-containing protein
MGRQVDSIKGTSPYVIAPSPIHGQGVFATRRIRKDEVIGLPLYVRFYIFPVITEELGRKINHSYKPNAILKKSPDALEWYLVAIMDIAKDEEITMNYQDTPWFIDRPMPWYK